MYWMGGWIDRCGGRGCGWVMDMVAYGLDLILVRFKGG